MTEGTSSQPSAPGREPAKTSSPKPMTPDQEAKVANSDQPSPPAQEPAKSRRGRSNEFWLALAGIAATVTVGVSGSWLAHQTSTDQMKAESERAALSFSREQRKVAYADYLAAVADLNRAEFKIKYLIEPPPAKFDLEQLKDQYAVYIDAGDKFNRAGASVRLLASPAVAEARKAMRDKHNDIYSQIDNLMTAAKSGASQTFLVGLSRSLDLDSSPDLEQHFIDAAKTDLGFAD